MSARRRSLIPLVLFVLATLSAQPGYAETDAEKAANLYKAGVDLYFAEDFGLAITKFRAGYELDPNAMFLYSLSLCFSKLQNYEQALTEAERAKAVGGMDADVGTKNDARILSFVVLVQSEATLAEIIKAAKKPDEEGICATNTDCGEGEICNVRYGRCVAEMPPEEDRKPIFTPVGWAGVGTAAVGIGMLVGGGVSSLAVKKNEDRFDLVSDPQSSEFDAAESEELVKKIENQKNTGRILILGGAGLTVVGASLVVVDLLFLGKDDEESSRVVPILVPGGAGLGWSVAF